MGNIFGWLGNAGKNAYNWASTAAGKAAGFTEKLVGKAADIIQQAQAFSGRLSGTLGTGYANTVTQQRAIEQQRKSTISGLAGSELLSNPMTLAVIAAIVIAIFMMKR